MNVILRRGSLLIGLAILVSLAWWFFTAKKQAASSRVDATAVTGNQIASSPVLAPTIVTLAHSGREEQNLAPPNRVNPAAARAADRPRFISSSTAVQRTAGSHNAALVAAQRGLHDYLKTFRENPTGTNAEIAAKLLGKNPNGTRFLANRPSLNEKGEWVDRWNQPIFFHQISSTVTEVRSAGRDHIMWTNDDEVLR